MIGLPGVGDAVPADLVTTRFGANTPTGAVEDFEVSVGSVNGSPVGSGPATRFQRAATELLSGGVMGLPR